MMKVIKYNTLAMHILIDCHFWYWFNWNNRVLGTLQTTVVLNYKTHFKKYSSFAKPSLFYMLSQTLRKCTGLFLDSTQFSINWALYFCMCPILTCLCPIYQ